MIYLSFSCKNHDFHEKIKNNGFGRVLGDFHGSETILHANRVENRKTKNVTAAHFSRRGVAENQKRFYKKRSEDY